MKYGPQTQQIEELVEKLKGVTPEQAERLNDAWYDALNDARNDARKAARVTLLDGSLAWNAVRDAVQDAAHHFAWGAAWDAALALLVQDKISTEHFDTLYGPWKSVMG